MTGPAGFEGPPAPPASGCDVRTALDRERLRVDALRDKDAQAVKLNPQGRPIGLALSGGGIRSATVCLGAVQALAENRLLRRLDYLSTVSGGGYIGCWFSAMLRGRSSEADPIGAIEKLISPSEIRKKDEEPAEIAFLRAYSNYLTPRLGLFSADTLAALTGYLRNLLLSLLLAVFSAGLLLALLHLLTMGVSLLARYPLARELSRSVSGVLLSMAVLGAALALTLQSLDVKSQVREGEHRKLLLSLLQIVQKVFAMAMLPLVALGLLLAGIVLEASLPLDVSPVDVVGVGGVTLLAFGGGAVFAKLFLEVVLKVPTNGPIDYGPPAMAFVLGIWNWRDRLGDAVTENWRESLRYVIAAAACTYVGYKLVEICGTLAPVPPVVGLFRGPALAVVIVCVVFVVWLGVVGTTYSELTREWLSRLLGTLVGVTLAWLAVGAVLINARPLMYWLVRGDRVFAFQAAWIVPTAGLLLLAMLVARTRPASSTAAPSLGHRLLGATVPLACALVTLMFMAAMTTGFQELLTRTAHATTTLGLAEHSYASLLAANLDDLGRSMGWRFSVPLPLDAPDVWHGVNIWGESLWTATPVLSLLLACGLGTWLAFRYIDVNIFSLQNLYRNRLVRCYLGAARQDQRLQNPYAGFDPDDDIALSSLAGQRPYHLVNAALNITQGDDLAWQQRKAASFCFSPLWSGYWLEAANLSGLVDEERVRGGYALTSGFALEAVGSRDSEGVMLGTAMATSGAAVSPQMGFASRGLLSFVLTLFNVRLGRWFPNTTGPDMLANLGRHSPRFAGAWYLSELLGRTNEKSAWVYLSDGGHFENLGIYELVRRRCHFIIAVDAGADPKMSFGDLGNCVRKCRVDFGVDIRIDLGEFGLQSESRRPAASHVLGKVRYPGVGSEPPLVGDILYIKSSVPATADPPPADILSFLAENPLFPHQPTADQWFTESQFESYRQLGYWIAKLALPAAKQVFGAIQHPVKSA